VLCTTSKRNKKNPTKTFLCRLGDLSGIRTPLISREECYARQVRKIKKIPTKTFLCGLGDLSGIRTPLISREDCYARQVRYFKKFLIKLSKQLGELKYLGIASNT
jgi:hypothetical protein